MFKKVLNVDDDEMTLFISEMLMKDASFAKQIDTAFNGSEALSYFSELNSKEDAPELLFLDLNMPEMNGWEFLEEFGKKYSEIFPDIFIVVLSSTIDKRELDKAESHPLVSKFVCKPLTEDALIEIKNHFSKS